MGIIRLGPPTDLILQLKNEYKIDTFVETGTYKGNTAVWAAEHFANIFTVEFSKNIYKQTKERLDKLQNVRFIYGNSKNILKNIIPELTSPAFFWLDSHWSGGETWGQDEECPLLDEIAEINKSDFSHYIFIDDARLFLSPPPFPHNYEHWPTIVEVLASLQAKNPYYIVVIEDVVIAVPKDAKDSLVTYCQRLNTEEKENYRLKNRISKKWSVKHFYNSAKLKIK